MDRRQRKTREAIFRAFTGLLKEENYAKITVQQIIDRAQNDLLYAFRDEGCTIGILLYRHLQPCIFERPG